MQNNIVPLLSVCDFKGGSQPPKSEWIKEPREGYIRMLQIRDFTQGNSEIEYVKIKETTNVCKESDILIARYGGSIGKIVSGLAGTYNVALIKAIPNEEVLLKKYLYYFLKSSHFQNFIHNVGSRAAQAGFNKEDLKSVLMYLPSIEQQEKIVEALDKVILIIECRNSQIAALDELTQSLFLEMFGDPKVNNFGWETGLIKDLTESTQYGSSEKADEIEGQYPILRMNNITYSGGWDLSNLKYIELSDSDIEKYTVRKGDILFNRTNSKELVGKTAVFREEKKYAYAGYLVRLRVNEKGNPEFVSAYLNSKYGKGILLNKAKSIVGMANINAKELQTIPIYLPPIELQNEYALKNLAILKQKETLLEALKEMQILYNALLQKAFKGELFQD